MHLKMHLVEQLPCIALSKGEVTLKPSVLQETIYFHLMAGTATFLVMKSQQNQLMLT